MEERVVSCGRGMMIYLRILRRFIRGMRGGEGMDLDLDL
jgi:hypothetical protein